MIMLDNSVVFIAIAAVIGLIVGSFLNTVIYRLPVILENQYAAELAHRLGDDDAVSYYYRYQRFSLCFPRSHCPKCFTTLKLAHLVPIFSYFWLRKRCASCQQRISLHYPLVEFLSSLNAILAVWYFGPGFMALAAMLFGWGAIIIGSIDQRTKLLPSELTLPLFGLGLLFNLNAMFVPLADAVMGGMLGYSVLWLLDWVYIRLSRRSGIGYGDFAFLAAIGAWLGWQQLLLVLLLGSLIGAVSGGLLIWRYHSHLTDPIAFGPYLAIAAFVMLYGDSWLLLWLSEVPFGETLQF